MDLHLYDIVCHDTTRHDKMSQDFLKKWAQNSILVEDCDSLII
jgi:hypothetical protein